MGGQGKFEQDAGAGDVDAFGFGQRQVEADRRGAVEDVRAAGRQRVELGFAQTNARQRDVAAHGTYALAARIFGREGTAIGEEGAQPRCGGRLGIWGRAIFLVTATRTTLAPVPGRCRRYRR